MINIFSDINKNTSIPLYIQVYESIKSRILTKEIASNEKLPSLRNLADSLGVSITTVELAYEQLLVEGYIFSKPKSGYFVNKISSSNHNFESTSLEISTDISPQSGADVYTYDLNCFDFAKWKKCINKVYNYHAVELFFESDITGEYPLRKEISKYLFRSRGVNANPDRLIVAAGTQQITRILATILKKYHIQNVSVESPGYLPVINIFNDNDFFVSHIPVLSDGIDIGKLPTNIPSAVYVNPSNQFPTGAIMPIAKRFNLLDWAYKNNSFIIEDDYDSELRYFGKPVPAMQGLTDKDVVIYLGSFSSTVYSSLKISYMLLPKVLADIWYEIKNGYSQTCSKTEQLALAIFMKDGSYQIGIKKIRKLYENKLKATLEAFKKYGNGLVEPKLTQSGINIILSVKSNSDKRILNEKAKKLKLRILPANFITDDNSGSLMIFYYNQIPLNEIDSKVKELMKVWRE